MVAADRAPSVRRRTTRYIELKVADQARTQYGDRIHINVTSYNGIVLLTGEVPDQGVGERRRYREGHAEGARVQNEMVVAPTSSSATAPTTRTSRRR